MDFEQLYADNFYDVYRYLLSLCRDEKLAEELTQETFFKALKNVDKFQGTCKVSVWLCQIAKNSYFSHLKKQKGQRDTAVLPSAPIEEKLIERESAFIVHKALHQLEEPYKEVFSLRVFGELPFRQIGELFEKNENWARITYHRAKLKLKEVLE